MDPAWLTAIGTIALAAATVGLAFVATFQDRIRAWLMRPKLGIDVVCRPPDCHKTQMVGPSTRVPSDCYYLRFRVKNSGNLRAELVEVYAAELLKRQADGSFKRQDWFLPMNLRWSIQGSRSWTRSRPAWKSTATSATS